MEELFCGCLYFTANRLSRIMTRMAEEEFSKIGLSPTYAYLIMVVKQNPGISQKDLSDTLHIAQSTNTRFIDKLVLKGLVERKSEGKLTFIYLTEKGHLLHDEVKQCLKNLYHRYSAILGHDEGANLTAMIHQACEIIEKDNK